MELQEQFEQAAKDVMQLSKKPGNETLLQLYSLHKQASVGDVNVDAPSNPFDFVGRAKHQAWSEQKGKSKEEAMQAYVNLVNSLKHA